ncbi:DUF262 domain-containing protein [Brachyspira pilosicoli]|uniref:DUF262 domain-containing protein n=1 Tax=Brachyspira pilosicoli TaxID=52584 RepID=UPI00255C7376|nr:DUF262 domain-containing HNH endonuclease family protein [Brachyspira pilosicoli]
MSFININELFNDNNKKEIEIPDYQRAYSWEEDQIKRFLSDIEEYIGNKEIEYYMGHFLFEKHDNSDVYYIIDGQQRLTTIVIFMASIINIMNKNNILDNDIKDIYDSIKNKFSTVSFDNNNFIKIIENNISKRDLITLSQKRMHNAYKIFTNELKNKKDKLKDMFDIIMKSRCSEYVVSTKSQAVQMFIYENDRGKNPTNLDILKSLFIHTIYINSNKKEEIINDISSKFEEIFKSISKIEDILSENIFLEIAVKTFFSDLKERGIEHIRKYLNSKNDEEVPKKIKDYGYDFNTKIDFINDFVNTLVKNGEYLVKFVNEDKKYFYIHSIISLGINVDIYPLIIFPYKNNVDEKTKKDFIEMIENILIRSRVINTRKKISSELRWKYYYRLADDNDDYNINDFVNDMLKAFEDEYFAWSNKRYEEYLNYEMSNHTIKFILWKYENYLLGKELRYDDDKKMHNISIEHIAPIEHPNKKDHGFGKYDGKFKNLINSLGNCLLLDKDINNALKNSIFCKKLKGYNDQEEFKKFKQQEEIINKYLNKKTGTIKSNWDKNAIEIRKAKIINTMKNIYIK